MLLVLKNHNLFEPIGRLDGGILTFKEGEGLPGDPTAYSIGFGGEVLKFVDKDDGPRTIKKFLLHYISIDPPLSHA